jgi:MFS family permease
VRESVHGPAAIPAASPGRAGDHGGGDRGKGGLAGPTRRDGQDPAREPRRHDDRVLRLYIFGTAAALVFGPMFFPKSAPETQTLNAYLTFGLAFLARPVGSFLFGHFGDRIGRKSTLVATMITMGMATTLIGALPSYATAGVLAPILLAALRFLQGVGLGGEWGGAALIAVENAPKGRRAWFGMFPQLGPPIGFFIATSLFLALIIGFGEPAFIAWAWRVPFLVSAILVAIGLYVRVSLEETPAFRAAAGA